jgi:hypothetical protein
MSNTLANLGQFYDGGRLWYGVRKDGKNCFVSSEKELSEDLPSKVNLRFPSLPTIPQSASSVVEGFWSDDSMRGFLDINKKPLDPQKVFLEVKTLPQEISPLQENCQDLLTLYILNTGCYSAFQTTPCLSLFGNLHRGVLLLDALEKIAFRAARLNSPSSLLAARTISLFGSTLIIQGPTDPRSHGYASGLSQFLADGTRFSGSYQSLNECSLPTAFPIYSPKILSSLEIRDPYLKSLTLEIPLPKGPGPSMPLDLRDREEEFQKLRDSICVFCLENITGIHEAHKKLSISGLSFQDRQTWDGIFSTASYLDPFFEKPFLLESMVAMAKAITSKRNQERNFEDRDYHTILLVAEFLHRFKPELDGYYCLDTISEYINKAGDLSRQQRPEDVGRILNRCFRPKPHRERMRVGNSGMQRTLIKLDEQDLRNFLNDY